MAVDIEYLRRHYATLSDEALLAIERTELVPEARDCYDAEVRGRDLGEPREHARGGRIDAEVDADWLEDAIEVFSRVDHGGGDPAPDVDNARQVLEDAGIPSRVEFAPVQQEPADSRRPAHQWRVLVPGHLNLHAMSVLDRDLFNADFEAEWRTHLEMLSDEELRAMDPRDTFCGLFDRIERITRAYREEVERREL